MTRKYIDAEPNGTMMPYEWKELAVACAEAANDCSRKREESFQRCDTDGFLSQWALDLSSQLYRARATIAQAEGTAEFHGLYHGETRVLAKLFTNEWGTSWMIHAGHRHLTGGRAFIPCGKRSRIQKKYGLTERLETAPAWARMGGRGRGLSGTAYVEVYRRGNEWGQDAVLSPEAV